MTRCRKFRNNLNSCVFEKSNLILLQIIILNFMKLPIFFICSTLFCLSSLSHAQDTPRPIERLSKEGSVARNDSVTIFPAMTEQTFGSQTILKNCFTDLQGSPLDKKVVRPHPSDGYYPTLQPKLNQQVEQDLQNCIRRVNPANGRKRVALTFDLCERHSEKTGYDAEIVNYLRENEVKATFYAGGKWMHSHPDKTQQLMADPLFELGNHAWTHGNFRMLTDKEAREQILWTQAEYQKQRQELVEQQCASQYPNELAKIPTTLKTFRFPYGTCKPESLQILADYGLPAIQWDVVTGDPDRKQSAEAIVNKVLRSVKSGSIIVAHANGRGHATAQALKKLVPALQELGYEFVTVSELLASGTAETHDECYEEKPGDNHKYDKFGKGTD